MLGYVWQPPDHQYQPPTFSSRVWGKRINIMWSVRNCLLALDSMTLCQQAPILSVVWQLLSSVMANRHVELSTGPVSIDAVVLQILEKPARAESGQGGALMTQGWGC